MTSSERIGSDGPPPPRRSGRRGPRRAVQLPSGRHGLSASFVVKNQRDRILMGIAQGVAEIGYPALTVEDVISRAGVSRRTFYALFRTKEEAYLEAFDTIDRQLHEAVGRAYAGGGPGWNRLRHALGAFLEFVASEPEFAHMCIVDVLAAGPAALARRDLSMRAFAALFDAAASELVEGPLPPITSEALVGGVYEVVYKRVLRGETELLPDLLPDLFAFCLVPYVGRAATRAQVAALGAG